MLTAAFVATILLSGGRQVTVITAAPAPAVARPAGAPGPEGDTRRVCRLERATGSNMQQRVCRTIRVGGVQDQQTREFMRNLQRIRFPDGGGAPTPGGPNGG